MNKIAIITLTTVILGSAQADYTLKVPLENEVIYYNWSASEPILGEWENTSNIYDCTNWLPLPPSITIGQSFIQTATDCKQDQTRPVQDREVDEVSGSIRDSGEPYTESRTTIVSDTRDAIGSLETWAATTPTYTEWVNSGGIYGCSNWTPDPATVTTGQSFDQTATDCKQNQTRSRQEREQETTTLAIRDLGSPIVENQTITVPSTRTATGTKIVKVCNYKYENTTVAKYGSEYKYFWGGTNLGTSSGTTFIKSGYKYTRGTYKQSYNNYVKIDYYEICREPS